MIVTDQPHAKIAPQSRPRKAIIAIHGGAGGTLPPVIPPHLERAYRAALRRSLTKGYDVLSKGGSALEAVCKSVQEMEDDPLFNAAKGAVFTKDGTNECEASVMIAYAPNQKHDSQALLQRNRRCASAVLIRNTRNPILLAKALYENAKQNPHVMLSGKNAEELGWRLGCERVDDGYYFTRRRWLEHRQALGLSDDEDPAMCQAQGDVPEGDPFEAPPSYYANTQTDETPSLYASSQGDRNDADVDGEGDDEKETSRSTTTDDEAVTPSSRSMVGEDFDGDVGLQYYIDWDLDFDTRRPTGGQQSTNVDSESVQDGSWRSSSFEELALPAETIGASLHRHQSTQPLSSLPQGTVGAVALDEDGNLAVATSTGGVTNKLPGRIGDTPTPGAGFGAEYWKTDTVTKSFTPAVKKVKEKEVERDIEKVQRRNCVASCNWIRALFGSPAHLREQQDEEDAIEQASNRLASRKIEKPAMTMSFDAKEYKGVALSGTGTGDYFLRCSFASLVVHRMRFLGEGVDVASSKAVAELSDLGGIGGAICLDESGRGEYC